MGRTNIEWVKNPDGSQGYTWNPITGCLNHDNGLCKGGNFPCYAYKLANGRLKPLYLANDKVILPISGVDFNELAVCLKDPFYPRYWQERVREEFGAWTAGAIPKGIFVCDMGDLFGIGVPEQWTRRVLSHIGMSWYSEHRFYILTKQAQRLPEFSPFPDNAWIGITVTNQQMMADALFALHKIEARVKYVSFEPLLGRIAFDMHKNAPVWFRELDWIIIGACTGTLPDMALLAEKYPDLWLAGHDNKITQQPKIEWVREIDKAADKAGVKIFMKE